MAVKAAIEQSDDGGYAYLRAVREGLLCFRRKLDTTEALVEEARLVGLDVERFRIDLASHAIVEAFAADLELARAVPAEAGEEGAIEEGPAGARIRLPAVAFFGADGVTHWVFGQLPYERYRAAAESAGARAREGPAPSAEVALERFGRMATREVAAVCDLPGPRAPAELWQLACEGRVKPVRVLAGYLWELV
jgi:hypothetical protein